MIEAALSLVIMGVFTGCALKVGNEKDLMGLTVVGLLVLWSMFVKLMP